MSAQTNGNHINGTQAATTPSSATTPDQDAGTVDLSNRFGYRQEGFSFVFTARNETMLRSARLVFEHTVVQPVLAGSSPATLRTGNIANDELSANQDSVNGTVGNAASANQSSVNGAVGNTVSTEMDPMFLTERFPLRGGTMGVRVRMSLQTFGSQEGEQLVHQLYAGFVSGLGGVQPVNIRYILEIHPGTGGAVRRAVVTEITLPLAAANIIQAMAKLSPIDS